VEPDIRVSLTDLKPRLAIKYSELIEPQLVLQATAHGYSGRASANDEDWVVSVCDFPVRIPDMNSVSGGHLFRSKKKRGVVSRDRMPRSRIRGSG